jgi:hypothetical protein
LWECSNIESKVEKTNSCLLKKNNKQKQTKQKTVQNKSKQKRRKEEIKIKHPLYLFY